MAIVYIDKGSGYGTGKDYKAHEIVALEEESNLILASYKGYYNHKSGTYTLYPEILTQSGKEKGYKMSKQIIEASEINN